MPATEERAVPATDGMSTPSVMVVQLMGPDSDGVGMSEGAGVRAAAEAIRANV